ncbi:hypothetical protein D3C76_966020 [compost metagenome]
MPAFRAKPDKLNQCNHELINKEDKRREAEIPHDWQHDNKAQSRNHRTKAAQPDQAFGACNNATIQPAHPAHGYADCHDLYTKRHLIQRQSFDIQPTGCDQIGKQEQPATANDRNRGKNHTERAIKLAIFQRLHCTTVIPRRLPPYGGRQA